MKTRLRRGVSAAALLIIAALVIGHPFAPLWQNGSGPAVHHQPVAWPAEPANPLNCGATCGDWKPYTRFRNSINDPRVQDPSNGGTAPQNYVNVSSSCSDKIKPSIYYYLHQDALDADKDVLMFRWRVEQPAHNYATGPSAGAYSSSNPWSSALWTVLFDVDGSGYRSLAAHLNGSSGSPSEPVDILAGIWGETPVQSLDYLSDPKVHLLGHNPTAVVGPGGKIMNFGSSLTPSESWPNGASETSWDYGMTRAKKVSSSPCTEYFIDYQIPVAMLDATAVGGPKITRDKPISMLFCTANGLNNPFQKDCAINRTWAATATTPAPFGDYLSFDKDEPYQQPIVSSVTAQTPNACPGSHALTAKVQDALALDNGVVRDSIKAVDFFYWYDRNGDGEATAADTGSAWTKITPTAALAAQTLNTWTADWDASWLPKGKYLIGVQAVDDSAALDDGMTSTGVDNRTFSYLSGDASNKLYIGGVWQAGQQVQFLPHSPAQTPSNLEDWYGNPSATGNQVALVGTAINACGVAPTMTLAASPTNVAAGATVGFTVTLANPASNPSATSVDSITASLPAGFSYVNGTSAGVTAVDPAIGGQQLTWALGTPASIAPGANVTLTFDATAANTSGTYNATASAVTSFGTLNSAPASIAVDAARLSLSSTPNSYSVPANGSTPLTFTLTYANDSAVEVTNASITNPVPAGATYVSCAGGTGCSESAGSVTFTLGTLAASAAGSVNFTITVPNTWATSSLTSSATLAGTAPDGSPVTATASSTVAVTGLAGSSAPALRLSKSANVVSVAPGGSIIFTLSYENYGAADATSVVLEDTLPTGFAYTSCSGGCTQSSGIVTWNIGTVAAGTSGTRTVTVSASNPFTASNPAVNNASITWSGGAPATAQATVGVTGQACSVYYFRNTTGNVGFDGTQRTASVTPLPIAADTGAKVTATAPVAGASFLEVLRFYQDPQTQNDVPFNGNITTNVYIDRANGPGLNIRATVYDYNAATGAKTQLGQSITNFQGNQKGLLTFAVTPSGTLAKGHRLLWVYDARADHNSQTVQVEFQFAGTVTNGISGGTTFANSNAQYCVTPPASLTLSNTVDTASIAENTTPTLTYALRYANSGSAQATNLSLVGSLPTGFTGCQYSTDNSTWNACSSAGASPPSHTFTIASLAGGSSGTVYVRGAVPANTAGPATLTSTSTLVSDQTTQVSASASTAVTGSNGGTPALFLDLAANRSTALPGQSVIYTLTVVNVGDAAATNVELSNALPIAAYYSYASCTGSCVHGAGTLTWPTIATLAAGASQSYTYTMAVSANSLPSGVTTISDDADAAGAGGLSVTSNSVGVTLSGNPALEAMFAPTPANALEPGDTVTYSLSAENTGATDATGVAVTTTIPAYTTFVSTSTGTFDPVNNRVSFAIGTLASGASTTVSFIARVSSPLNSGATSLVSTASLSASNTAQQTLVATATATAAPGLFISNDAPSSVALPSAVLTAAVSGQTLFVDRSDRFTLGQLVSVGNDVAAITAIGGRTITVDSPMSAASGTPVYGAVTLTITYRNDGNANASGVSVHQALPAGLVYFDAEPAPAASPIAGESGNVDWSIGALNAGAGGTLRVLAFPSGAVGSFTSTATISAANAATRTANAVTVIGGLSVTKTTSTPVLSAGDQASYSIVASNSLQTSVLVDLTDILPDGFSYQDGSATVDGASLEPTFDSDDAGHVRPIWSGVQVPAAGSLAIMFKANVGAGVGALAYQNELRLEAPAAVAVLGFDPLTTTQEDVTVLAANEGVLQGYVFRRFGTGSAGFNAAADAPLAGVRVEIHKAVYDCNTGVDCYVAYSDGAGAFERVVVAGDWIVTVVAGSGDLDAAWAQVAGANNNTLTVPAQGTVVDQNGYRAIGTMHLVTANAGGGGSVSPASDSVEEGDVATFTVTPAAGYVVDSVSGCGGTLAGNTFTTTAITGACTVEATFRVATYLVSASAGAGGSISPASSSVNHGATATFAITPSSGFHIASVGGCGGTLAGSSYTTQPITAGCSVAVTFTIVGPTIATPPPARINARSLFTLVPQSLAPAAADGGGAPLPVTLVGGPLQLMPGRHTITWRAADAFGRVVSVDQQLDIWPTVSLSSDLALDYGSSGTFNVLLNGPAPLYPYTVEFAVGGDGGLGTKHTLASGFVTFESGTERSVSFDTLPQPNSPLDHRLSVTLDPAENIGERGELNILLRAMNFAPQVGILVAQADRLGTLIAKDGGTVTLHAVVEDPNVADSHTFQWSYPPGTFPTVTADGNALSFEPAQLAASLLGFAVVATDDGHPPLTGQMRSMLAMRASAPVLGSADSNGNGIPDNIEGWSDSGNGIPRYLNRVTARNVLPENAPVADRYLIESEAAIRLRVGAAAQLHGDGGARLGSATVPSAIARDEIENVGGYFSFEAHELAVAGDKVRFVVPQRAPIPADPFYRLWDHDAGRWLSFVEDANNTLESAAGEPGICPGADSSAYTRGLKPGHLCVRMTVQDGGINDLDRQMNKTVLSTGGVGARPEVEVTGTSGGGGGAMNGGWLMLLGLFGLLRQYGRRAAALGLALALFPFVAFAQEHDEASSSRNRWQLGATAMFVQGSVDGNEMDARIARAGYQARTQLHGQSRLGGALFAAYRRRYLGIEAAYVELGELTTRVRGTTPVSDEYLHAVSRSHPQSGSGPQLSALAYWPLGERLEVVGRFGAFYWRSNMDAQGRSLYQDVEDRALDPAIGLGLSYRITGRWTALAHFTDYRLAGERISSLSLGIAYRYRGSAE